MSRVWFLVLAVLAVSVVGFDDVAVGSDERHYGGRHHTGPPDTFVTDWDAIGTQAFTAAALTPAEGHTIFAYVGIAVYDSWPGTCLVQAIAVKSTHHADVARRVRDRWLTEGAPGLRWEKALTAAPTTEAR